MSISSFIVNDIIDAFEQLKGSLSFFDKQLALSKLPISLPAETGLIRTADKQRHARQIFTDIWHSGHQDGRRTHSCFGLVGANPDLLAAAEQLNEYKDQFRICIGQLKKSELPEISQKLHQRSQAVAASMNQAGLGRLHLKQCYRHIPLVETKPDNIRFSWYSSGRSIRKVTAHDAMEMLLKLDISQTHINRQIEKLSPLDKNTPLAQIQKQVPVIRANIAWKIDATHWQRIAKNCPLPILIPLGEDDQLPVHNNLAPTPPAQRSRALRSDSIIDPEPFLPTLRIHLYRK